MTSSNRHRHLGPHAAHGAESRPDITDPAILLNELEKVIADVERESADRTARWRSLNDDTDFVTCSVNLSQYLSLRQRDLRPLQRGLTMLGLSSLGRAEGHVLPALKATRASLEAILGRDQTDRPAQDRFFAGEQCLVKRQRRLFGKTDKRRPNAIMVTCPSEAADDPGFMLRLAERGVEALRINCAHDGRRKWTRMIDHVRTAEKQTGHRIRVFMDLAGPKIRTGKIFGDADKMLIGDRFRIIRSNASAPKSKCRHALVQVECTLEEAVSASQPGDHVFYDDGKLSCVIEEVDAEGLIVRIENGPAKGAKLKPEKGLNFPDANLGIAALTDKDRRDLRFIARHADGVQYSFVQSAEDVRQLQSALSDLRDDWQKLALVLKIETIQAIDNLPEIIAHAASQQPAAIMIARGDLAVEIGFARMAEMQEEILWLAEAAHVPVIWATQVLENLVKKGRPSRGEMTDAAMAARAECVMLNKGPHLLDAIDVLDTLLERMGEHQHKKTARLRALNSW